MAERPRVEPITVGPDGNVTTEGVFQPATGTTLTFQVENGVVSVQGRQATPMDIRSILGLLGGDVRMEGTLLKSTPPAAPAVDPAIATAAAAARRGAGRAARIDSPEDIAFDARLVAARASLQGLVTRQAALAQTPPPPITGRAQTTAMETARSRAQGVVDGRLTAARNDVGQGAADDLRTAEAGRTTLEGHATRITALRAELETEQNPAEQTRIREEANREMEAAELAMERITQSRARATAREGNTPEGFVTETLRAEADSVSARLDAAVRARDALLSDHDEFVRVTGSIPRNVTGALAQVEQATREVRTARVPAIRADRKGAAEDPAIAAERAARETAEELLQRVDGFIQANNANLSIGAELQVRLVAAEANIMTLRQELATAERAVQLAETTARIARRSAASVPTGTAAQIATIEAAIAPTLQAAQQRLQDLEARYRALRTEADEGRTADARRTVDAVRGRGWGARLGRMGQGILGAVTGVVPAVTGAVTARSDRRAANARSIELDERYDLQKTIRELRKDGQNDTQIRDTLNRLDHTRIRPATWTAAVDYAFEEADISRHRREAVRNAGATALHHGRRAVDLGMRGIGATRAGYQRFTNFLERRDLRNTMAETILIERAHDPRPANAAIAHELEELYSEGIDNDEFEGLVAEAFREANRRAMVDAMPDMEAHDLTQTQMRARFARDGLLSRDSREARETFAAAQRARRFPRLKNFIFGKPDSTQRKLWYGIPALGGGLVAAGVAVGALQVLNLGWQVLKGGGRTIREVAIGGLNAPQTTYETAEGRVKQATSIWNAKGFVKEEVKTTDGFLARWGKRARNAGRSVANAGIYLGSKPAAVVATPLAAVGGVLEGLFRSAAGMNPYGKHDNLLVEHDGYEHAKRGGLLGIAQELWNTTKETPKAAVAAAQVGPFTGAFKETEPNQGPVGKLTPNTFSLENLGALFHAFQGAHYMASIGKFLSGKRLEGVTPVSAPAARPAATPAAAPAAAPAGAGAGHDHGHGHAAAGH